MTLKRMRKKRKALRSVPGARRKLARRFLKLATIALIVVMMLMMAGRSYLRGGLLTVTRIEVAGNVHWDASRLLERAGVETGGRLHEVPFRGARRALVGLPGIESASVRYLPGGTLRLHVREAAVVAMRRDGRGWQGLTRDGSWLQLDDTVAEDVPVLEAKGIPAGNVARLGAFLAEVRDAHPDLYAGFAQISVRPGSGHEALVYWRDGRLRLRVDYASQASLSLALFRELLRGESASWRPGSTVDLRVEGYAYVR